MKTKLMMVCLLLSVFYMACEEDDAEAGAGSEPGDPTMLIGTWSVTSYRIYETPDCTGDYESGLDSLQAQLGAGAEMNLSVTADSLDIGFSVTMTDEELCALMNGTVDGDSCSTDYMAVNLSDFCTDTTFFGGTYSSDGCTISDNLGALEYTVDGNAITLTDSAEVLTGEWSITDNTLDLFFGGDSGCNYITGTKQ